MDLARMLAVKRPLLWALLLGIVAVGGAAAAELPAAVTAAQLESDWQRQLALRFQDGIATPADDAAGGCDGAINGGYGFHTSHEDSPWWQVDLGQPRRLAELRIFNRCDAPFAGRAAQLKVLLSEDAREFQQAYQHDGRPFFGAVNGAPLIVPLQGAQARFVRIALPGREYLHLDEVEVYALDSEENIALGRDADQSSISEWSVNNRPSQSLAACVATVIERGRALAQNLQEMGVSVDDALAVLDQADTQRRRLGDSASDAALHECFFTAQRAIRAMALANPLLDFDAILFVKGAPGLFPHMSDQYYGWWSRGGGGLYILSGFKGANPVLRCLTDGWDTGSFIRPCLSYDGRKALFAYAKHYPHVAALPDKVNKELLPEDAFYHVYEMTLDSGATRQLTHGRYDDFDARYLPSGDIVFLSTRKGTALQAGRNSAQATLAATLPDSYVRCGGDSMRPVAVYTLHAMDADGANVRAISAFENFEWTPSIAHDGRILYARWDYIDRFNGDFISLWAANPDGANAQLVYGNYTTKPQCVFEAHPIPGSRKLVFTATAHHSITGGSLVLLDRNQGTEYDSPITRLTPEVCFPETEGWPSSYYISPWPLSEEHYLAAWADKPLPAHTLMPPDDPRNPPNAAGIYLYDAFGNLTLIHRDPEISSQNPIPLRPRQRPHVIPDLVDWEHPEEGAFLLTDVYNGLEGVPRGAIKRLRIVGVVPKVQPTMNQPMLGVSSQEPGKFVLGSVPVEEDGSAHFRVPSGVPYFFQALDENGLAMQTMRTLTYVQPGQTLSCNGCHEPRGGAPVAHAVPLAARRAPSPIAPGPPGSWPLRFDELVQPVLDRACVRCHQESGDDPNAAQFQLVADKSFHNLLHYADKDLYHLVFEKAYSEAGDCPARKSLLFALITDEKGHHGVQLTSDDIERLATWMDTYGHKAGAFSDAQETDLRAFRNKVSMLFTE